MWQNELTDLLKVNLPIIQAPMAGGPTTSALVAAVSNAGGLGTIGAGYMSPSQIEQQIREVKQLTDKNFGVNLFVPVKYSLDEKKLHTANQLLQPIEKELNVKGTAILPNYQQDLENFHEQIRVIINEKVPVCSFTFGLPSPEIIALLKKNLVMCIGTATTVQEAIMNEKAGMEAVVVQGSEAGGHRSTFYEDSHQSLIGLMSLVPQVADMLNIPLIAAGGIMDGRGIMATKCLGAHGVQMGTAFLVCDESGASQVHKNAIIHSTEDQIVLTRAFSGKMARGLNNLFIEKFKRVEQNLPDYPIQNELTKGIRKASTIKNNTEYMSLWAGQSPRLAKKQSVKDLLNSLLLEAEKIKLTLN